MSAWNILYRGPLSSCNYDCGYCPFAKTSNTRAELQRDEEALDRFVQWVARQRNSMGILFTPWGEALIHSYYRRAIIHLSRLPNVTRVSIQTNLSAPVEDLSHGNIERIALWTTFHPSQTTIPRFVSRCQDLDRAGLRYSVGVVGLRENFGALDELRRLLPRDVYLWINAYKRQAEYYTEADLQRLLAVDPYFHWNLQRYPSSGKPCAAGETTFTVDGDGNVRRCHFIDAVIGNIYHDDWQQSLKRRLCSSAACGCHIGYIHRPELQLDQLFGPGLLERIPSVWPEINPAFLQPRRQ